MELFSINRDIFSIKLIFRFDLIPFQVRVKFIWKLLKLIWLGKSLNDLEVGNWILYFTFKDVLLSFLRLTVQVFLQCDFARLPLR